MHSKWLILQHINKGFHSMSKLLAFISTYRYVSLFLGNFGLNRLRWIHNHFEDWFFRGMRMDGRGCKGSRKHQSCMQCTVVHAMLSFQFIQTNESQWFLINFIFKKKRATVSWKLLRMFQSGHCLTLVMIMQQTESKHRLN